MILHAHAALTVGAQQASGIDRAQGARRRPAIDVRLRLVEQSIAAARGRAHAARANVARAIGGYQAGRAANAGAARAAAAIEIAFLAILDLVAAGVGRAARGRADARAAVGIGPAAGANRARLTARAAAIQVGLGSVAQPIAARRRFASFASAAKAVAIFVEATMIAARAATRSAGFPAVHVGFAPVPDSVGAARRRAGTREANPRSAIGGHQAGLPRATRRAAASTIEIALAGVSLPIQTVRSAQRLILHAVLGERAPRPAGNASCEQARQRAGQPGEPRLSQPPILACRRTARQNRHCPTL